MHFAAEDSAALRRVVLDSLTAIYHRRSGQTHLVAEPVPALLDALADASHDLVSLLARLGIDDSAEARALLSARLDELIETGLVRRA